jgi:formate C-acetyltransferase
MWIFLLREAYMDYINELKKYHTTRYGRGRSAAGITPEPRVFPRMCIRSGCPGHARRQKSLQPLAEGSSPSSGTDELVSYCGL